MHSSQSKFNDCNEERVQHLMFYVQILVELQGNILLSIRFFQAYNSYSLLWTHLLISGYKRSVLVSNRGEKQILFDFPCCFVVANCLHLHIDYAQLPKREQQEKKSHQFDVYCDMGCF